MKNMVGNFNIIDDIMHKTENEIKNIKPISIILIGKTGVGKSTLINRIFRENLAETGIGSPVTKHLRRITKDGVPIVLYDTKGLELNNEAQKEVLKEIFETISEGKKNQSNKEIHLIYYCINANSSRIEPLELELIEKLSTKIPVVVILTQSIGNQSKEFGQYIKNLNLPIYGVVNVMAQEFIISNDLTIQPFGLKELIEMSFQIIPDEQKRAFNNAQQVDIERKAKSARSWAFKYIASSFGVGFMPIPFSDASILVPMQLTLLAHITAIFGISMDKATITSMLAAIGGTGGATYAGRYIVSTIIKLVPGVGTIIGGVISGATASIMTTALALSYIEVLTVIAKGEKDGKYPDLKNIEKLMKEKFENRLKNSKKTSNDAEELPEEKKSKWQFWK
ncbi:YcjF family protein [Carnobacterium sp. TMP28]|uniref:YcjF family protein n=1 Tax=Carnobacterium sp. TMP28 TaxID=3397060 RepID=UPI0039E1B428